MSDWDFLHDMHNDGYSAEQIADAAACGYNPWEWQPLPENEWPAECLQKDSKLVEIFESLVDNVRSYHTLTGRYLQIWGELGELYAEITYSIKRHRPMTQGSDGRLGNDHIEIKTISPEKNNERVEVNLTGNFNKLLIVKISEKFEFDARFIDRKAIAKNKSPQSKNVKVNWKATKP